MWEADPLMEEAVDAVGAYENPPKLDLRKSGKISLRGWDQKINRECWMVALVSYVWEEGNGEEG